MNPLSIDLEFDATSLDIVVNYSIVVFITFFTTINLNLANIRITADLTSEILDYQIYVYYVVGLS